MKHYSTYQSQFIEMFGSNDCKSKPLSDLTSLITKGTTPTSVGFNFEEDGIKYIKAENICEDTSINLNDCMHISQDCHNTLKRSQLQNGDILFSIAGVIGRVGVITKECLPANTNQALAIIRFDTSKEINKEYAKHALLSPFVESQWKMKMRGAAQMNISLKDVGDINIPLPSLAKQEQFCQIAEQADKSKFTSLKSQFIEMFGGIQDGSRWPLKSLADLCDLVNGYAFKSTKYSDSGYSIIRIANVQKGTIDDSDKVYYPEVYKDEFLESILNEGDILVSLTGNVGRVGVIEQKHLPAALNQRVQCLRIKDESILNHQYLFSLLNLDDFENLCIKNATGSAQLNLSTVWLRNCRIVCPPIEDQIQFARIAHQADKSKYIN